MKYLRLAKQVLAGVLIFLILSIVVNRYETDLTGIRLQIRNLRQAQKQIVTDEEDKKLPPLIKRVIDSVVYVEVFSEHGRRGSGSGVIIAPNTILTAMHMVRDANSLTIRTTDGKEYKTTNWKHDPNNDCAILFFGPEVELTNIAEFGNSDLLVQGEDVFIIGSPFGNFNMVTAGIFSGLIDAKFFGEDGQILVDAAANPGNSGGPVFNMEGKIIGILVGGRYGSDGWSIVTPGNICKELLSGEAK